MRSKESSSLPLPTQSQEWESFPIQNIIKRWVEGSAVFLLGIDLLEAFGGETTRNILRCLEHLENVCRIWELLKSFSDNVFIV